MQDEQNTFEQSQNPSEISDTHLHDESTSNLAETNLPERGLREAIAVLEERLNNEGLISTRLFLRDLKNRGFEKREELIREIKYFDFDDDATTGLFSIQWKHFGRSFYTLSEYDKVISEQDETASEVAEAINIDSSAVEETECSTNPEDRKHNKQEESRLGQYVLPILEDIYWTDGGPDSNETEYVFDVHSRRPGSLFENVDLLAVHWHTDTQVELVTVEVKLAFSPQAIHQALNYTRFSDRVWLAVPVTFDSSQANKAALALRAENPTLFDYAVNHGLGILACRRARGRSYDVFPVHWPRRCTPDPVEKEKFIERYRDQLEDAEVVERRQRTRYPKL